LEKAFVNTYSALAAIVLFFSILSLSAGFAGQVHIVIDPGHGTAHSRVGAAHEAELVMAVAVEVQKLLKKQRIATTLTHTRANRTENMGATPSDDTQARVAIANKKQATLFVRLHGDEPAGKAMICYPALHKDKKIAHASKYAAECLWKHIVPILQSVDSKAVSSNKKNLLYKQNVCTDNDTYIGKQNGGLLEGSRYSQVPVVLIELFPLNQACIEWLSINKNQQKYANAIVAGIQEYVSP